MLGGDKDGSMKIKSSAPFPSPVASKVTSFTTKANDSEPVRRKFFIGMEISFEHLKLEKIETLRRQDDGSLIKERRSMQSFIPEEGTKAFDFFQKVVDATETWFSLFGWLQGPNSISIPESVRRAVHKILFFQTEPLPKNDKQKDFAKYNRTIYDMLLNLSGKLLPGVNSTQSLPVDKTERLMQLHLQHTSLLNFLNTQGACIAHVLPEFLLEPEDYKKWIEIASSDTRPSTSGAPKEKNRLIIDITDFEALSKRAWTDVLLQIYKVLILSRVAPHSPKATPGIQVQNAPKINPCFVTSNVYSAAERILLSWLNTNYENTRHAVWKNCRTGVIPPEKWIVNFDKDLLDGLVLAAQMAAYCPFLIDSHFIYMYTQPKGPEQHLHNCLVVVNAFRDIGFNMDTQAYDICHPNPVLMLMLCVYMHERLPAYLPRKVVLFPCTLHETVTKQILLKNPSTKRLVYRTFIVGRDATDFALFKTGKVVTISPKNQINIMVKFTSRFLYPAEATLLLISKSKHADEGTTMTFALKGEVLKFAEDSEDDVSNGVEPFKFILYRFLSAVG
ncbi:PREDICTED: calponin homology domain-containing protein 2 [Chrysochloris asiatica]|uniref:Calponin homology domain-containing protein 2 n=1 Tax=Chrysochloris asiatica TaxID=185453 RepID=A0A9B0TYN4_CHRAS|nr:PREDICTED: calponin homology domain-containing protein 2 [Chrysochloris asiatica]